MKKYILLTRSIVIVNTYWQISGHIGHREPTFNGEIYTHILLIQLKKKTKLYYTCVHKFKNILATSGIMYEISLDL